MEQSIKQKQVASMIEVAMDEIFRAKNLYVLNNGLVSISEVKVTPDLLEAKIFLSFFQIADKDAYLKKIKDMINELRLELGKKVKNKLRKIPVIQFFKDDTIENGFKIEELLKQIKIPKSDTEI